MKCNLVKLSTRISTKSVGSHDRHGKCHLHPHPTSIMKYDKPELRYIFCWKVFHVEITTCETVYGPTKYPFVPSSKSGFTMDHYGCKSQLSENFWWSSSVLDFISASTDQFMECMKKFIYNLRKRSFITGQHY
jgi:hypothetical protein